jgi:hypothetical protein
MSVENNWEDLKKTAEQSKIRELLEKQGLNPDEIGKIAKVSVSSYQTVAKDEDGNPQVFDLEGIKYVIHPAWNEGPQWEIVRPADPVQVNLGWTPKSHDKSDTKMRCAFILPDPQIGYRRYEDGTLDPFHDEMAIDVALQVMAYVQEKYGIDVVINLGDFLDLPEHSKYIQEAAFANTTQAAINYGHEFLAKQRAIAPDARIILLEGNHDDRLSLYATRNARASYGLKRADSPDGDPVLSVQNLLCLKELGVEFYDKYPSQESYIWLGKYLRAMHGNKVRSTYTESKCNIEQLLMQMVRFEASLSRQGVSAELMEQYRLLILELALTEDQDSITKIGNKVSELFGLIQKQAASQ